MCFGTATFVLAIILAIGIGIVASHGHSQTHVLMNRRSNGSRTGLWTPALNTKWQIILSAPIPSTLSPLALNPNVNVFEIDMFGNDATSLDNLHQNGKNVICYFSGGSYEPNRPDSAQFQPSDMGNELDGWPGEFWLKLSSPNVRSIMQARVALAASKGCDAIDADNVDSFENNNGLGLTQQDSIDFVKFLSQEARKYNMTMGLKNALMIIDQVIDDVDFAINEQCVAFSECHYYSNFVQKGKPVFHIEYPDGTAAKKLNSNTSNKLCSDPTIGSGSTILKSTNLDGWGQLCDGTLLKTPIV